MALTLRFTNHGCSLLTLPNNPGQCSLGPGLAENLHYPGVENYSSDAGLSWDFDIRTEYSVHTWKFGFADEYTEYGQTLTS